MGKANLDIINVNDNAAYNVRQNLNGANSRAAAAKQSEAVESLVRYLEDRPIVQNTEDTFSSTMSSAASGAVIFEGTSGLSWLKKAKGVKVDNALKFAKSADAASDAVTAAGKLKEFSAPVSDSLKGLVKGSGKFSDRAANYMSSVSEFQGNARKLSGSMSEFYAAEHPGLLKRVASKIFKSGSAAEVAEETVQVAGKASKLTKAAGPFAKLAEKFPVLGKAGKAFKSSGAGFMVVLSGIFECFNEIIPTFKELGVKAGLKQTGKSAVKVAADTTGWILGSKGGAALGAAIGTFFCPGVGTAIGAALGNFIGGFVGAWALGKVARAITGPTEREKAQAERDKAQAETIQSNAQDLETLKQLAYNKAQGIYQQNGYYDEESKLALENIEQLNNPFAKGTLVYA